MIKPFQKSIQCIIKKQYGLKTVRSDISIRFNYNIIDLLHSYKLNSLRFMATMDNPKIKKDHSKLDLLPTIKTTNTGNTSIFNTIKEYTIQIFDISKNMFVSPSKVYFLLYKCL